VGDGAQGAKLDITAATLANKPKAVIVTVDVERIASGTTIVFLKPQGHKRFTVVSEYDKKKGTSTNSLIKGRTVSVPCSKMDATWSPSAGTVQLRVPANCIDDGDYDLVKFKVLTERPSGGDTDLAPQAGDNDVWRWSEQVARG
jgi:hypothetical protein